MRRCGWLPLVLVALVEARLAAPAGGRRLARPPCACVGHLDLSLDPRVAAANVALTMVTVYKSVQPGSPNGRKRFATLTAAMFDAYAVASGDHPAASGVVVVPGAGAGGEAVAPPAQAVATAAAAVMAAAFADEPPKLTAVHDLLRHHGYGQSAVANGSVGARVAAAVLAKYPVNPPATPYTRVNPPSATANADCGSITDADGWQPVCVQREPRPPCAPQVIRFGALANAPLYSTGGATTAAGVVTGGLPGRLPSLRRRGAGGPALRAGGAPLRGRAPCHPRRRRRAGGL